VTSIAAQLEEARAGGATAEDVATIAGALLGDPALVAPEVATPERAFAAAAGAWGAMDAEASRAWQRYPSLQSTGVHGGEADPRAAQLFSTLTYLRGAGFYTPEELATRATESANSARWAAREAVRLQATLVALSSLVAALDSREVEPAAYPEAVSGLAHRFAGFHIAAD